MKNHHIDWAYDKQTLLSELQIYDSMIECLKFISYRISDKIISMAE